MPREDMAKLITVLIPNFNGAKYLKDSISSVMEQDLHIRILVVDNGSTDNSLHILRNLQQSTPCLDFVVEEERGVAFALQNGLTRIKTPYTARLDSDDYMLRDRLQEQLTYMESHNECVLVGSQLRYVSEDEVFLGFSNYPAGADVRKFLTSQNPIAHPSVMFRTDAARAIGGYRISCEGAEDLDLWFRLGQRGSLAVLNRPLTAYRIHPGQVSKRNLYYAELKVRFKNFVYFQPKSFKTSLLYLNRIIVVFLLAITFGRFSPIKKYLKLIRSKRCA